MPIDGKRPERLHLAQDTTCRRCGADCYWQEVYNASGEPVNRLFDETTRKPHDCSKAAADDFEDVSGT